MEIVARIMELVALKAKSKREFSSMIGIEQTLFNNYMIGKRDGMNFDIVDAILRTFPEVSAEWFLRGEGSMIRNDSDSGKALQESDNTELKFSHTSSMYEVLIKDRDEQIEELKAENNRLIGENSVMREQLGIGTRSREKSA